MTPQRQGASVLPRMPPKKRATVTTRASGAEVKRMTVYLPADLARRLAVHCAERGEPMSDAITIGLTRYLNRMGGA